VEVPLREEANEEPRTILHGANGNGATNISAKSDIDRIVMVRTPRQSSEESLIFSTGEWKYEYRQVILEEPAQPAAPTPTGYTPRNKEANPPPFQSIQENQQEPPPPAGQENFSWTAPVDQVSQDLRSLSLNTPNYGSSYSGNHHCLGFKAIQLDHYEMLT
jgi:hypothetical protein